jgi:hypothetical protein
VVAIASSLLATKQVILPTKLRIIQLGLLFISCLCALGCEAKRPPGFLSIGKVSEVATQTRFLREMNFYLTRDQRGLSIMSTLCRYDRLPLRLINENGKEIFVSDYNPSRYDISGHVIAGPAKHDLFFYSLSIDSGVYGGPKDTLYVQIGEEVGRDWRLKVE